MDVTKHLSLSLERFISLHKKQIKSTSEVEPEYYSSLVDLCVGIDILHGALAEVQGTKVDSIMPASYKYQDLNDLSKKVHFEIVSLYQSE